MHLDKNKIVAGIGFASCVIGLLGLLLGRFFYYIFPLALLSGLILIINRKSKEDLISGITSLIVSIILISLLILA